MSKATPARGLKQAIVGQVLVAHKVTQFSQIRKLSPERKTEIVDKAQAALEKEFGKNTTAKARQIINYMGNPENKEVLQPLSDIRDRLKAKRETSAARRPAKKAAKKASTRKHTPTAPAEASQAA